MATEYTSHPRVGVPYRTETEELAADRSRYEPYVTAVRAVGGEPIEISLHTFPPDLKRIANSLDAIVLPGSPADVDPSSYRAPRHKKCGSADPARERTDFALLEYALAASKPVLAICYGIQSLNVFLGGSLIQDIQSERSTSIRHDWEGRAQGTPEPFHSAQIEPQSRLHRIANGTTVQVNSSHHQSIAEPGRNLKVVARASDGIVEAMEWMGDIWVTGVQWHPERMVEQDQLALELFRQLVATARKVSVSA